MTEQTDYGKIQKAYSIWICNERIPASLQNTVTMYSIKKTDMIGKAEEPEEEYDLMDVIIIRRGKKTDAPIFDYLSGVFHCDKEKIAEYVDIEGNEKVLKGVDEMSGLGQSIMNEGMQKGMQEGENLLATLVGLLKRDGRLGDLDHISDEESRKRLYKEYHLID